MIILKLLLSALIGKLVWEGVKPSIGCWYAEICADAKPGKVSFDMLEYLEKAYKYSKNAELFTFLFQAYNARRMVHEALELFYIAKTNGCGIWHKGAMYIAGAVAHQNAGAHKEADRYLRMATTFTPEEDPEMGVNIARIKQIFSFARKRREAIMKNVIRGGRRCQ